MPDNLKLKFTSKAKADMTGILDYISDNLYAPAAATKLIDKIEKSCQILTSSPLAGSIPRDDTLARKGYRMLVVDNYLVFYTVDDSVVRIMHVVYGRRNFNWLF